MPQSFKAKGSQPPRAGRTLQTPLFTQSSQTRSFVLLRFIGALAPSATPLVSSTASHARTLDFEAGCSQPRTGMPSHARAMVLGLVGVLLAVLVAAPLVHAQGYNDGGYGGKTAASGGGGGSVSGGSCSSNQYATSINSSGVPTCAQPSANQVSGLVASATTDTTNASNIASGTLNASRLPTITSGNVNSSIAKTANNLSDLANAQTAATNLGLQYYADNCGLPNNGSSDDAAGLRTCMANMPAGATMNLDGSKPYYISTGATGTVAPWGSDVTCGLIVKSGQTLNINGAHVADSSAFESVGGYVICAGSPNFNYPGSNTGSPAFDNIAATAANATQVVLATHADAANYHSGDDLYIDGGTPTNHICIGWDQVSDSNASTGVIDLKYPLIKPYPGTSSTCAGGTPRISDWTTCGGNNSNCGLYNLGPLATDITIENGTITRAGSETQGPILLEGTVHPVLRNLVLHNITNSGSGAIFANNNHLGIFDNIKVDGYGCTADATLQSGAFTSSRNLIENSIVSSSGNPGIGCGSSLHEIAFADEEGNEANYYKNDTATILPGNTGNAAGLISCVFNNVAWNNVYDGFKCNVQNGSAFLDQGGTGITGPTTIENSDLSATAGNTVETNVLNDIIQNNRISIANYGIGLYAQSGSITATGNTILDYSSVYAGSFGIDLGTDPALDSSTISNNTLVCLASGGSCSNALVIPTPGGGSSTNALTVTGNQIPASFSPQLSWPGLGALPNATVSGNGGVPDTNGSGSNTPSIIQMIGSPFGTIGACQPMVLAGSGSVNTPGSASATGVIGFNPSTLPQNTSGQTGAVVTHGLTCGICDGTCSNGDLFEMSPTSATQIHDIGTSCSGAAAGAQVGGYLAGSGTSGGTVAIFAEPGVCPPAAVSTLPASQVTGLAASATTNALIASNINSGTLPGQRLTPAVSAPLNNYYAANGQSMATFGGFESNGSAQVTELTAPTGVACTCAGGTGTTYSYAVSSVEYPLNGTAGGYQAVGYVIQGPGGESARSSTVTCSGPSSLSYPSNYCIVTWNPWSDVVGYKVWGRIGVTTSLTGISANTGTGGMLGNSFVDYGVVAPQSSSQYQTGLFKAEGGLGTGDWSPNGWPGQPGDVYFKELGSNAENVVMGSTNDQLQVNGSSHVMKVIATGGLELNSDTVPLASQIMLRGGLNGDTGPLTSINGTVVLNGTINADAIKLEHLTAHAASMTCTTNPTFTVYDCGTTAVCSSPVTLASVTPASTGLTSGDAGITTSTVTAGHYIEIALTAGACTALNGGASVEWAGN